MRRGRCLYYLDRYEEALGLFPHDPHQIRLPPRTPSRRLTRKSSFSTSSRTSRRSRRSAMTTCGNTRTRRMPSKSPRWPAKCSSKAEIGRKSAPSTAASKPSSRNPKASTATRFSKVSPFPGRQLQGVHADFRPSSSRISRTARWWKTPSIMWRCPISCPTTTRKPSPPARNTSRKFPDGRYAGDMRYRLAFIDFNDKDVGPVRQDHPRSHHLPDQASRTTLAAGSMLCLIGDTYKKKNPTSPTNSRSSKGLRSKPTKRPFGRTARTT